MAVSSELEGTPRKTIIDPGKRVRNVSGITEVKLDLEPQAIVV